MSDPEKPIPGLHPRRQLATIVAGTLAAVAVVMALACSSASPAPEKWTASYLDPPDRLWAAITQTLEALGYDIEDADRHESVIVATTGADDPATAVTLRIAQVAHSDVVRVHVGRYHSETATGRFDAAAREFLASLDAAMRGTAPGDRSDGS